MAEGLRIDTGAVGELARDMRAEADGGLAAAADRGAQLHRQGVGFGARLTPSSVVTEVSRGSGVTVALIDTGVDAGHRDLAGAVLSGYDTRQDRTAGEMVRQRQSRHGFVARTV